MSRGDFRIVQDDKEFTPTGRIVCGDHKGFFWTEVGGDDSFLTISLGRDDPFKKRFEFRGNGVYLDGNQCELEDR
jgi:hypothetical protein